MILKTKSAKIIFPIAFGTMGLAGIYAPVPSREHAIDILCQAVQIGYNLIDTALVYGDNVNGTAEKLIAAALEKLSTTTPYRREDIFISTKGGLSFIKDTFAISGNPKHLALDFSNSLAHLKTDYVDAYFLHRVDPKTPLRDSLGFLAELKQAGKIRYLGISEVDQDTIFQAIDILAEHDTSLDLVQNELSLISRDDEFNGVLTACAKHNISYMAYAPIGRGLIASAQEREATFNSLSTTDIRQVLPRYNDPENMKQNSRLIDQLHALSSKTGADVSQLSLAWLHALGKQLNVDIIPITGTKQLRHLEKNYQAAQFELSTADLEAIKATMDTIAVQGERWPSDITFSERPSD
jgi:aryl-alcohol dehydrogenase-like predicted oxidoreductase